jgi:hypothetical protein
MDRAAGVHPGIRQEYAGAVLPHFKSISPFQVFFPYFPVAYVEMACNPVDIGCIEVKGCTLEPVTAIPRTIVAEILIGGETVC